MVVVVADGDNTEVETSCVVVDAIVTCSVTLEATAVVVVLGDVVVCSSFS